MGRSKNPDRWIQETIDPKNKGKLHRKLNVPEGKKIPEKKLDKALHSKSLTTRREAQFAENVKKKKK